MAAPTRFCTPETRIPLPDPATMLEKLAEHFETHGHRHPRRWPAHLHRHVRHGGSGGGRTHLVCHVESASAAGLRSPGWCWRAHLHVRGRCAPGLHLDRRSRHRGPPALSARAYRKGRPANHPPDAAGGAGGRCLGAAGQRPPCAPAHSAEGPRARVAHAQADGRVLWPQGADALSPRVYTLRHVDVAAGEATLDIVLHPGAPGSDWAREAAPGQPAAVMGPGGGLLPEADWVLFAGDETALPAIARMVSELPPMSARWCASRSPMRRRSRRCPPAPASISPGSTATARRRARQPAGRGGEGHPPPHGRRRSLSLGGLRAGRRPCPARPCGRARLPKNRRSVAAYWRRGYQGVDLGE